MSEPFACRTCNEPFGEPMWHCPACSGHTGMDTMQCAHCPYRLGGPDPNPPQPQPSGMPSGYGSFFFPSYPGHRLIPEPQRKELCRLPRERREPVFEALVEEKEGVVFLADVKVAVDRELERLERKGHGND